MFFFQSSYSEEDYRVLFGVGDLSDIPKEKAFARRQISEIIRYPIDYMKYLGYDIILLKIDKALIVS